jgi:hypothetical protein
MVISKPILLFQNKERRLKVGYSSQVPWCLKHNFVKHCWNKYKPKCNISIHLSLDMFYSTEKCVQFMSLWTVCNFGRHNTALSFYRQNILSLSSLAMKLDLLVQRILSLANALWLALTLLSITWQGLCHDLATLPIGATCIHTNISAFCPQSVFMCDAWFSEQTVFVFLYSITQFFLVMEIECICCDVRFEFRRISPSNF